MLDDNINAPGISCATPGATASGDNASVVCDPGEITVRPPPVTHIPTPSEWAMLLLMGFLAGAGLVMLRSRRTQQQSCHRKGVIG